MKNSAFLVFLALNEHKFSLNANLVGGDISGGLPDWRKLIVRPTWGLHLDRTAYKRDVYFAFRRRHRHLATAFRRHFGLTPRLFRQQMRQALL